MKKAIAEHAQAVEAALKAMEDYIYLTDPTWVSSGIITQFEFQKLAAKRLSRFHYLSALARNDH